MYAFHYKIDDISKELLHVYSNFIDQIEITGRVLFVFVNFYFWLGLPQMMTMEARGLTTTTYISLFFRNVSSFMN